MDLVTRLDNYNAPEIAIMAIGDDLFEEAYFIYNKYDQYVDAVQVLIKNIGDIDRGYEFAERVDLPEVWSKLGQAQLEAAQIKEAIGILLHHLWI